MPIFDTKCIECGHEQEVLVIHDKITKEMVTCSECGGDLEKIVPQKAPKFKLVYDNTKDMVDWDGNTSRYWDSYKEAKARGEDVRIPKHDGE